jgi:hypothetical protein
MRVSLRYRIVANVGHDQLLCRRQRRLIDNLDE